MLPEIKITVLRRFHPDEVFGDDYPIEKQDWMGKCYMIEDRQEFTVKDGDMPEGFCSSAWTAIYPHLRMLIFGGDMPGTEPGIAIGACSDGLRPVVFKIERME